MSPDLKKKADQIRHALIEVAVQNGAGHIAPSLSSVDLLVALYYRVMRYRPRQPRWENRDRLIFSKAHGVYALYAILADLGVLPDREWKNFYTAKSTLKGCLEYRLDYGFEAGCGSLGHGLPMAVGQAFGAKLQKKTFRIFCVVGDGEMQEGSVWEALQFAVKHQLDNLTIIVDSNRLQAMDFIVNVLDRSPHDKVKRLKGFGLKPMSCDGHDVHKLVRLLSAKSSGGAKVPRVLIAETTKGYGLKCMESVPKFHFRLPTPAELRLGRHYACCD